MILEAAFAAYIAAAATCPPHQRVKINLLSLYGEIEIFMGAMDSGSIVRIYFDANDKSWSATLEDSSGLECMKANGFGGKITGGIDA